MFFWSFNFGEARSVTTQLPRPNLIIDPRPVVFDLGGTGPWLKCNVTYHDDGRTVTITIINEVEGMSSLRAEEYRFRVFDPATERVPNFESTTYNYLGNDDKAPRNTLIGNVDKSLKVVGSRAFHDCSSMKFCSIHDDVEVIEKYAFMDCKALKIIKLPRNLKRIGQEAFRNCKALDAIFIPPGVEDIGERAFSGCENLRILSLPPNITAVRNNSINQRIGSNVLKGCDMFYRITNITCPQYGRHNVTFDWNGNQIGAEVTHKEVGEEVNGVVMSIVNQIVDLVNQDVLPVPNEDQRVERRLLLDHINACAEWIEHHAVFQSIIDFYNDMSPLNRACHDSLVSPKSIHDCTFARIQATIARIQAATASLTGKNIYNGMMPLHILTMNPHATPETILACLNLSISAAITKDNSDMMPIDYLWKYGNVDSIIVVMQALCLHRDAHSENCNHEPKRQRINVKAE